MNTIALARPRSALALTRVYRAIIATDARAGMTLLRIALAVLLFPHGAQHLLGWFGGYGFAGTHQWMTETLGFPAAAAAVAIVTEFVAPIALVAGVGGRIAALGLAGLMLGAISTHTEHGFFMNWFGALPSGAEGFEYHLLVLAMSLTIVLEGSGAWSVDRALSARPDDYPVRVGSERLFQR